MDTFTATHRRRPAVAGRHLSPRGAYAVSAAIVGAALFASVAPSPLYETYARLWGFSSVLLTLVFATYAVGVLAALLLAGRLSDVAGRRPVLAIALSALLAATALYIAAQSVTWLFAARGIQGLATGLALGTASAGLLDFHPRQDSEAVSLTNGVVSAAGLALGGLASSTLVQFLPAPRVLPYVVVFILFAVALVGVALMPEPVAAPSRLRLSPQRPHVPSSVRQHFVLAALAVIAAYSIGGLLFALGPALSARVFESTNHLVTGTSLFLLPGAGAIAQLAYGRRSAWVGAATGAIALAVGVALIALAAAETSAAALIVGLVVGGAGFGLAFLGSLRALSAQIPAEHRASVMSAFFIAAYAALSIPAVLAGFGAGSLGLDPTFEILGAAVATIALAVAAQAWRTRPRTVACTAGLAM
ncbi:MAG TPA: MFS transporter [Solirubrobacteraceae bacterium]|nr:MFS transporter [Solirubrobacteraceae bacterium]